MNQEEARYRPGYISEPAAIGIKKSQHGLARVEETAPVKIWAAIGGLVLAFEIYVIFNWITGPYFTPVDPGPTPVPGYMLVACRTMEIGFCLLWIWCIWNYIVQPYRKEGRFSTDGLLCLGFFVFIFFQDPLADYGGPVFTYNAHLWNMGSWLNEIPSAVSPGKPGAQLSEPLWTGALYPSVVLLFTILGTWFMRKLKQRFRGLNTLGLISSALAFFISVDVVLEGFIFMPLGVYTYAGAPDWLSMHTEHYYKYTFVEGLGFGAVWTCWACLRYYKDDRGLTVVERGVEDMQISQLQKTILRFLAIGGFLAATMIVCVNVPFFWMSTHMSEYPEDIQKRSYFLEGLCGEGTNQACFGPAVPNSRANVSARIGPHGELVAPSGAELPKFIPFDR